MYTVKDYVKWRGDLSFEVDGINEVDNIAFCCLSYVELSQAFENLGKNEATIRELGFQFFRVLKLDTAKSRNVFFDDYVRTFKLMYQSKRFSSILVRNYNGLLDKEKTLQFAAMEFVISDNCSYVAFRGTDDSIIGWEEDFLLATKEIEAEREASKYLSNILEQDSRRIVVGGHSKGGHLAVYACLFVKEEYQERITDIYCNDGPGFLDEFLKGVNYHSIERKIKRFMPEDSVVGQLLTGIGDPIPIKSQKSRIFQHTASNWAVEGTKMVRAKGFSEFSIMMKRAIAEWLDSFDENEKAAFFKDLFSALEASGEDDITSIKENGVKGIQSVIKGVNGLNTETKEKIILAIKDMITEKRRLNKNG